MRSILIDPGHGGSDPGACGNGLREADLNLQASKLLIVMLRQRQYAVYLTRSSDTDLNLDDRCEIEHRWKPDLTISIHCNAAINGSANGFEVWTSHGQTASDEAAECIIDSFHRHFPARLIRRDLADGDQDKEARFRVLTGTIGPAVLVEMGFISNADEAEWLRQSIPTIVAAICDGVQTYFREVAA